MAKTSVTGFPRIGEKRELKKALESYWKANISIEELNKVGKELRTRHLKYQKEANIEYISVNDFSFYDNILDTIVVFGLEPKRFKNISDETKRYFAMARGDDNTKALEMTKWFNTNYHYLVPELSKEDEIKLNLTKIKNEYNEAKELGIKAKINIIGIISFLKLSKRIDGGDSLEFFDKYLKAYVNLLEELSTLDKGIIVQFDEASFVSGASSQELELLKKAYNELGEVSGIKIIVATYFEHSNEASKVLVKTPIYALALDFVYGELNKEILKDIAKHNKVLFAGIVDGRNIWINDIEKSLKTLEKISKFIDKENIIISSSCSFLHLPYTLKYEDKLSKDIKSCLAFALEKLEELRTISTVFFNGRGSLCAKGIKFLEDNKEAIKAREDSSIIHNKDVQNRLNALSSDDYKRALSFDDRIKIQKEALDYPSLATTTIGSFPQTKELRKTRLSFKKGDISKQEYEEYIKNSIKECIEFQEEIGLDVLVHGEFERNDMVEFFGERLEGFAFSSNAWVQSYGSRCVKPPIIFGDVSRPKEMTVSWALYAQSLSDKPLKGMLTGPVTILNWSFVRNDISRDEVCKQVALAIRDEVDDLQNNNIKIIQVDEAAFKEGYPLREEKIEAYEKFALDSFLLSTAVAYDDTQIHTHMCYSEFNDIIKTIEDMDADVISIETARSGNELLKIFKNVGYKQEIGPGVYDIHSPRVPSVKELKEQIKSLLEVFPKDKLWINPDCGLKTRADDEVKPSLRNMVEAVKELR